MPIGLGIGMSHSPAMYTPRDKVRAGADRVIGNALERGNLIPTAFSKMTKEDLEANWDRFRKDHAAVKAQIEAYHPDVLIMLGGDHGRDFGLYGHSNKINMLIFTGSEASAQMPSPNGGMGGMMGDGAKVRYKCDPDTAKFLADELISKVGFDLAVSDEMRIIDTRPGTPAEPEGSVLTTSFMNIHESMPTSYELPIVMIYLNTFDRPTMVSAKRCYDLGVALAKLLEHDKRKIAILGSGGLSHDPFGPRNIWNDTPLDQWMIEQFTSGNGKALQDLYYFDSMTVRGGTGETRCWITVAGAMEYMGAKAKLIDYHYAPETQTGNAFAYWLADAGKAAKV